MASHKFKVGQTVEFAPSRRSMPAAGGEYKVVRLMPADGGVNSYRVKCSTEAYERTARETELTDGV